MRFLAIALLLGLCPVAFAAQPAEDEGPLFLYNVAVLEFNGRKVAVPWQDFGQPQTLANEVHKKTANGSIDSRAMRKLDILKVARHLNATHGASVVANVPARPGDVVRAPCGVGTNVTIDFTGAAAQAGPQSTLLVKVLEIDSKVPEGAEFAGALTGAGSRSVDQATVTFPTVEGDTIIVEVNRHRKSQDPRGCIILVTP